MFMALHLFIYPRTRVKQVGILGEHCLPACYGDLVHCLKLTSDADVSFNAMHGNHVFIQILIYVDDVVLNT